jgi:excisionase family DNA binding protein
MNPQVSNEVAPLFTVHEVAKLLHVHPNTLRRWSDQGVIRTFRICSRGDRRYRKFDVYHFISELRAHDGNFRAVKALGD